MGYNIELSFIQTSKASSFEVMVKTLLSQYKPTYSPMRLTFFGRLYDNERYISHTQIIEACILDRFGNNAPVFTYVSQAPFDQSIGLVMEAYECRLDTDSQVEYKSYNNTRYIIVSTPDYKLLHVGGIYNSQLSNGLTVCSDFVFNCIKTLFDHESMPISSIVRQWNYIENILGFDDQVQRYQIFNDARTRLFETEQWLQGYPSATGIGAGAGQLVVELIAYLPFNDKTLPIPIDNTLQIAAHEYSQDVLLGQKTSYHAIKTTPKFERAKLCYLNKSKLVYISGTAAIRGEKTIDSNDILAQTTITADNVDYLISVQNLKTYGVSSFNDAKLRYLRVYVKRDYEANIARDYLLSRYPNIPILFLISDICRDDLLIEIEGIAEIEDDK